jgi:isopropylmalate/homocitrate/citramalate synthase
MTRLLDPTAVLISEVGPRDGLQSVKAVMPTADKLRWVDALVASGLREIEVGSFVPPQLMPQMADTAEVVRHALQHADTTGMANPAQVRRLFGKVRAAIGDKTGSAPMRQGLLAMWSPKTWYSCSKPWVSPPGWISKS